LVKLNKIYTRTGDGGSAGLVDGSRVSKSSLRMTAIGEVDEANASIGVAIAAIPEGELKQRLLTIQNDLFDLGADLCAPEDNRAGEGAKERLRIVEAQVERLEQEIDAMNAELAPLNSFVLPGGSPAAAYLHLARTIARRAERDITRLAAQEPVNPAAIRYINRLSDHLFVMARWLNDRGAHDVLWKPGANR